ncbi:MAG: MFS transporter [Verrucomicrobia bacterium]|nr:MFS transporter [Verrucomicrobiota bacterium]
MNLTADPDPGRAVPKGRTLFLCTVLHAFTHLYMVALLPLYYLVQVDLGLASVAQATFLVTAMMLAYFLVSYPMGILADRLSRKRLLSAGLALNALGIIGLSCAPDYPVALACAVVAGLGGGCYHPPATALIVELYPVNTGRALGLSGIGASVGFFLSPLYCGWRAAAAGWRAPLLELGLLGLGVAAVFFWLAQEGPRAQPAAAERSGAIFPSGTAWLLFLGAGLLFSLRDLAGCSMGSLGSLFLQRAHRLSLAQTGLSLSAIFLASAVSNPLFGHLSDRGRSRWTAFILVAAAAVMVAFPHLPRAGLAPALMVYGFFFLASYPTTEAALMLTVPAAVRGRVFGMFITMGGLVGNLGHWLAGAYVERLGPAAAQPSSYDLAYGLLGALVLVALGALPCLRALRRLDLAAAIEPPLASVTTAAQLGKGNA